VTATEQSSKVRRSTLLDDFIKPGLPLKYRAPKIAGLPKGWSRSQAARFLQAGVTPEGGHAGPPKPQYRFSHAGAEAIAIYLQSLAGA
jgi:hypothetical protein